MIRVTGDWDLAEECVQDAFEKALLRWPLDGVPERPAAWLRTTARNRALDRLRRSTVEAAKLREVALMRDPPADDDDFPDERLRLIFTCCHPALPVEARVALTLRTVAGLTTEEIARAFLLPTATLAQRLVRAKGKIRAAGIPYRVPSADLLTQRTTGVLAVIYLLFNEGYSATSGDGLMRRDLAAEALRLGRLLVELLPGDHEVTGLLALMLLQDARRDARTAADGQLIPLEEQDRGSWDRAQISEGLALLAPVPRGAYELQAAIAACHVTATTPNRTDWTKIAFWYDKLAALSPSPFIALNRAVAVGMSEGFAAGLGLLEELDASGALAGYYLLPATRADFLRRSGNRLAAIASYEQALALAPTTAERAYLRRRILETSPAHTERGLQHLTMRAAAAADHDFLLEMLVEGVNWTDEIRLTLTEIVADPHLYHYVDGWRRTGDFGTIVVDESAQPVGAAWCRTFPKHEPGYGFVSEDIPEVSLAVRAQWRGQGAGTALLAALLEQARQLGVPRLSLSVEDGNAARRLYERNGFVVVGRVASSDTMLCTV